MKWSESVVAKIGLLGLALVHWHFAGALVAVGLLPMHVVAVALVVLLDATSFALILAALAAGDARRASRWVFASFALLVLAYSYRDFQLKAMAVITTDGHAFMDVAARILVQGHDPYAQSLLEAFRIHELPLRFATPLADGDVSDRVAYPALSFLVLVPAVLLRIPTHLVYAACFVATLALVVWRSPWWLRALVLVLFLYDETFLTFSFGGVTDAPWTLCLVGALVTWRRPTLPFVLVGLACSYKQHPWFVVPFLLVLLWREEGAPPWRGRARRMLAIVGGVFAAINLPFVIAGPSAWLRGVFEPLVAPMITLSDGLSALTMTGYVVLSRAALSGVFWVVYGFALWAYAQHTAALRRWCWVLPGIALWFSHRALTSYWYFYALPAVAALVDASWAADAGAPPEKGGSPARTLRLGAILATALVALFAYSALRAPPFEVEVLGPMRSWDRRIVGVRLRVTNRLGRSVRPRFTVQSSASQPLPWLVDGGRGVLGGGQSEDYVLRAGHLYDEVDGATGGRLAVSDDGDPGLRSFVDLPADPDARHFDAVANGRFTMVDNRTAMPFAWTLERSDPAIRFVAASSLTGDERVALELGPPPSAGAPRVAQLSTVLALSEAPLAVNVLVPETSNRAPYAERYGLRLESGGVRAFVLFGERAEGTLPTGERFVVLDARRGAWTRIVLPLRETAAALGLPLVEQRVPYERGRDLDIPSIPLTLGLYVSLPPGATGRVSFGAVGVERRGAQADALVRRALEAPDGRDAWHAAWNVDQRNHEKAVALYAAAAERSPTSDRLLDLADEQRRAGRLADARGTYERALALGWSARGATGLGWTLLRLGEPTPAVALFERAAADRQENEVARPRRA
ncbi:MAG TPA: hypothetical protein VLT33_33545, partial [Labilithrix sp.]|nr:hypothetical protein [Labilithrix sp.]